MDRFTGGTAEGRDRVIAQEPIGTPASSRIETQGGRYPDSLEAQTDL